MGKIIDGTSRNHNLTPVKPLQTTSSPLPTSTVSDNKPKATGLSIAAIVVILLMFIGSAIFTYYQWKVLLGIFGINKK
jgi:hypothetical protein